MNYMMNLIGFKTILKKEIIRILRIWPQTLIPPIITTSLYFIIFGEILFKDRFIFVDGQEMPDANYVFVYTIDNEQVFTNTDQAVQVPDNYANS